MNILTSLKEITEIVDWMRINLKTEKIIKKVCVTIRIIIAMMMISMFLDDFLGNIFCEFVSVPNLWDIKVRIFFNSNIITIIRFFVLYKIIIFFVRYIIYGIENINLVAMIISVDDIIDIANTIFLFSYVVNTWIEKKNGILVNNEIVYVAIVYIIYICTKFIYIKNNNELHQKTIEYTNYYDVNNSRIPQNAYVIFYGKRYRVFWTGDILCGKNDEIEKEWKIILVDLNEETIKDEERKISLKDAVENRKGKLTIDNNMYWGNL